MAGNISSIPATCTPGKLTMCDTAAGGHSGREVQRLHHSEDKQATTGEVSTPDWIRETIKATESDHRKQPWREAFAEAVDSRFDDQKDLVRVEPAVGVDLDPSCPFRTQGSSLAA
jgi:hypothetical protein